MILTYGHDQSRDNNTRSVWSTDTDRVSVSRSPRYRASNIWGQDLDRLGVTWRHPSRGWFPV